MTWASRTQMGRETKGAPRPHVEQIVNVITLSSRASCTVPSPDSNALYIMGLIEQLRNRGTNSAGLGLETRWVARNKNITYNANLKSVKTRALRIPCPRVGETHSEMVPPCQRLSYSVPCCVSASREEDPTRPSEEFSDRPVAQFFFSRTAARPQGYVPLVLGV